MAGGLFAFVAGEASGDLLAAPVLGALRERDPNARFAGIAGDRMIAQGCAAWWHVRDLSVRGYAEVIGELPRLLRLRAQLRRRLLSEAPRVFVGVDAPDFNLRLETQLRRAGVPTVHYVSPSIWAWRRGRIEAIRRAADRVLLVFPFEQPIYDHAGIAATYVGHPLASQIPPASDARAARARLGIDGDPLIAVLPGSRRAEVEHIAPALFGALAYIGQRHARARFVVPIAGVPLRERLAALLAAAPGAMPHTTLIDGRSHDCLEAADGVLVASGTATLETALYKKPMVIVYRMPRLSWWVMRHMGYLPWVGLPNILANATLVPELLQDDATPHAIAEALLRQLDDPARCAQLRERFAAMQESLRRDTPALAAEAILATARR
ncbi:MAG: lipid-A-disaccharide synthase [Burkholderiaceae bacterium]